MKKTIAITMMLFLISSVIVPALPQVDALKADTSKRLTPKSYGEKTTVSQCGDLLCFVKNLYKYQNPTKDTQFKLYEKRSAELLLKYPKQIGFISP